MSAIINTGLTYIADNLAANTVEIDTFIFANIDGLDETQAVDPNESLPAAGEIVYTMPVTQAGHVSPDKIIYSALLTSNIGDFDFNWVGLQASDNTLVAVQYLPLISKTQTVIGLAGNNLVRNFLLQFQDAALATNTTIAADVWQFDFKGWLDSIDDHERLSNEDFYGQQTFFNDGWLVSNSDGLFRVLVGTGYVNGIRVVNNDPFFQSVGPLPTNVWIDVSMQGDINGVDAVSNLIFSNAAQADYIDASNRQHYLQQIASINGAGVVTDLRNTFDNVPVLADLVVQAELAGEVSTLNASIAAAIVTAVNTVSDNPPVQLSTIDDLAAAIGDDDDFIGTMNSALDGKSGSGHSHSLSILTDVAFVGAVLPFPLSSAPLGFLKCNGAAISRTSYANLFAQIGTTFGAGNGSTTFNLPDFRGDVIRGWDDGRGVDSGRVLGSLQLDAIQNIVGSFIPFGGSAYDADGVFSESNTSTARVNAPTLVGDERITFDASTVVRTATETRARNSALTFCIKY